MRNPRAFWAIVTALLSLAALAGVALAGRMFSDVVGLYEAMPAVPVALVLALVLWAVEARILRAQTLSFKNRDFVLAAKAAGEPTRRIVFGELMPRWSNPSRMCCTPCAT